MHVTLDTDRVSLIRGDSLRVLRSFADKSFDVTITDPPYNELVHARLGKERRTDGTTARPELTFPPMTPALAYDVMYELVRITRTWIIVFTDFFNTYHWGTAAREVGGAWVRTGQWVKTNPMPQMTGDRPATGSEDILIAHAQPDTVEGRRHWDWNGKGHAATWRGDRDPPWPDRDTGHPNQKPLWLYQSLLGQFCNPGALVLDPYFGSGGLAVAALATERLPGERLLETSCKKCAKKHLELYAPPLPQGVNVVGVEGDQRWIDLSISRIREASPSLFVA